ncbi:MAG: HesB/IscA family protein [Rickettsiaceae bacterium]
MQLQITDSATNRIKEICSKKQYSDSTLRITVNGGGCAGFTYKYEFITQNDISAEDFVLESASDNKVKIVIDKLSQTYLDGCIVNFVQELGKAYFEIKNPNATDRCGCGNSFSV